MSKSNGGFTVIELVVVLGIIALGAALAVPMLGGQMSRGRLNGAARQLMSDFMWARMEAVTQKNEFRVFFVDDHVYQILDDDDNDGNADTGERITCKDMREQYRDVRVAATSDPIFFPRGTASAGTFTVMNPSGSKEVKVHLTGRVKTV